MAETLSQEPATDRAEAIEAVIVPKPALDWLMGIGTDPAGLAFGEFPDDQSKPSGAFWWRKTFREISLYYAQRVPKDSLGAALLATARAEGRAEGMREAAAIAYSTPDYASGRKEPDGTLSPSSPYDRGRFDAQQAILAAVPTPSPAAERDGLERKLKAAVAAVADMTPEQQAAMWQAQRESFARAMGPCEHGVYDWEDCSDCRAKAATGKEPAQKLDRTSARAQGYTGNMCSSCGSARMQVAGHCEVCAECGTTTGCS